MSRQNLLTIDAMMDAVMVANHINHHSANTEKTAYMHSHIKQTKPNDAENSKVIVRVGKKKMLTSIFFAAFVFALLSSNFAAHAARHTVTNENNAGAGSLRETIANAASGDTIIFANNVNRITLTSGRIDFDKSLTIDGGSDTTKKVTITGSYVGNSASLNITINLNNLIFTGIRSGNYAVYVRGDSNSYTTTNCDFIENSVSTIYISGTSNSYTAINCNFNNNGGSAGGAVHVAGTSSSFTATNCTFVESSGSTSSAVGITGTSSSFTATNCTFSNNARGSVYVSGRSSSSTTINCTFLENSGSGSAVYVSGTSSSFAAANCTFLESSGGAIYVSGDSSSFAATNCTFNKNSSRMAVLVSGTSSSFTAIDCDFVENTNDGSSYASAVYVTGSFTATNCTFNKNTSGSSSSSGYPAVYVTGSFTATNCTFEENISSGNYGGAVYTSGSFAAANCIFNNNSSDIGGAVYVASGGYFAATNCTFNKNSANRNGGAIYATASCYLYHCTFDSNQASDVNAIGNTTVGNLYSYNCIYTGKTPIRGLGVMMGNNNLIEGVNGVTRDLVFGSNQFNGRYIVPLSYARTAPLLTASNIQVPEGITADEILAKLATDQAGNPRPISGYINAMYGAVESGETSIREVIKSGLVSIFPNPTSVHFTISFELEKSCNVKIILCDLLGQELAEVYNGFTSEGLFTKTHSTEHLPKGVYLLKILINGNIVVEKVIVE